ncbi:protein Z, vitamin K-dependent plasma glycoprotein a [Cyprinodon tularosa]|uniref:protein Z, vitamin K-dependent plasma glycoprotein a n=1 Tax=Cyprinodon tularosa TaxID=77115 RepID=UPI0018E26F44|nr:protein Z, vitamin K-dependent plasma glycoprotein a [Cyprinodon tularosa]XP_038163731.1 protein Z, vitamin K-dependent plasma glycoprotein a [Cyprinodon tularosa]
MTMHFHTTYAAVLCLAGTVMAIQSPHKVFLEKQQATALISRQKRNTGASTLEQACMERVCTYEEARKYFQDSYRTDIFWSVYIDGDQCAENPCKNGAMCSDSVGGYDCICKSGFTGIHCENDETLCTLEKDKGCSQFCKPGYTSYQCSCARGWKLKGRDQCEATVKQPCGQLINLPVWKNRQANIVSENFKGLQCTSSGCPWQALLKSPASEGYCSGVIVKENLVLTSAQCATKHPSFQVEVGKLNPATEVGGQTLLVKLVHLHPRYVKGRPENDLAMIELRDSIVFKPYIIAACLPEKDFAESILMSGDYPAVVTGWREQEPLTINQLEYSKLPQCIEKYPSLMTNKMGCTSARANADCSMSSGSPLLTMYRDVLFLTGVVTQPEGANCTNGYIFQKVSRHLSWLQTLMGSR